jgi:hypothetical protein
MDYGSDIHEPSNGNPRLKAEVDAAIERLRKELAAK